MVNEDEIVSVVRENNMIAGMQHLPNVGKSIFGNYHCSNTAFQIFKKMQLQLGLPEHCLTLRALISPIDDI